MIASGKYLARRTPVVAASYLAGTKTGMTFSVLLAACNTGSSACGVL